MCGRFTLRADPKSVAAHFELDEPPAMTVRYNIAPGQGVVVVRSEAGRRTAEERKWGLVPSWAKSAAVGSRMINARAETVASKPAFRRAFRERRCLIPADGFYEWVAGDGPAQPHHITAAAGGLFAFAGLWESWRAESGTRVESCSIVTTAADERLRAIHHRMPVILPPEDYAAWLDLDTTDVDGLQDLLGGDRDMGFAIETVSSRVNDVRCDDANCVAPAPPQPRQERLL